MSNWTQFSWNKFCVPTLISMWINFKSMYLTRHFLSILCLLKCNILNRHWIYNQEIGIKVLAMLSAGYMCLEQNLMFLLYGFLIWKVEVIVIVSVSHLENELRWVSELCESLCFLRSPLWWWNVSPWIFAIMSSTLNPSTNFVPFWNFPLSVNDTATLLGLKLIAIFST